ncbi:hypothetical protein ACFL6M_00330 [Candidatus Eisenbacteria bacterium]|uniref:Glycosyltransferase RgtA/B/C/D-like domain-containing protein n=1 Tax=Eiseniibacteriota bacterium TaxID=2212470 RepID=A0ABV6YI70_UNCEI
MGGLIFVAILSWAYSRIPTDYYEARDDGVITLSHARNLVDHGFIGVGPSSERVEGYSAPAQFFLYAGAYALTGIGYLDWSKTQTLVFSFLLGAVFIGLFGRKRLLALVLAVLCALFLGHRISFFEWHGSGLENPLTHFLFVASLVVLARLLATGKINPLFALVPFLASISRLDSIFHVAPVLLVFAMSWWIAHRNARGLLFALLVLLLCGAFHSWRVLYFGDWIPNTAYAQGISIGERLHLLARLNGDYIVEGLRFSELIFSTHGGFVLLPFLPLLFFVKYESKTVFLLIACASLILTAAFYPHVFGTTTLDPTRSTTHMCVTVAVAVSVIVTAVEKKRLLVAALAVLLPVSLIVHLSTDEESRNLCCSTNGFQSVHDELIVLAESEELPRPTIANPDLGAVSWWKDCNVVDIGMLGNPILSKLRHGPLLADYILEFAAPDLIECHASWIRKYHKVLLDDERFEKLYTPVPDAEERLSRWSDLPTPVGVWIRNDIRKSSGSFERRLIDDLRDSLSVERVKLELLHCRRDSSRSEAYVARSVYRFLPEFRAAGEQERLLALFSGAEDGDFGAYLLSGSRDGRAHIKAIDFIARKYLEGAFPAGLEAAEPIISGGFEVYLVRGSLIFLKDGCTRRDLGSWFFIHAIPGEGDKELRRTEFSFRDAGYRLGERGLVVHELPPGDVHAIRAGQLLRDGTVLWGGEYVLPSPITDTMNQPTR